MQYFVSKTSHRQALAFEEADDFAAHYAAKADLVLLLVCTQEDSNGLRQFFASDLHSFFATYMLKKTMTRYSYEILREGRPCRLYLDLEFACAKDSAEEALENVIDDEQKSKGVAYVELVLLHIAHVLRDRLGIWVRRDQFLEIDSSTASKFSRHVILHLRENASVNETLFESNAFVGRVVKEAVARMRSAGYDGAANIVDVAVYTRNRAFRLLYSSKHGRQKYLDVADGNKFPCRDDNSAECFRLFENSLICPAGCVALARVDARFNVLKEVESMGVDEPSPSSATGQTSAHSGEPIKREIAHASSRLRSFIVDLASNNSANVPAEIRAVERRAENNRFLTFHIQRNRYCRRVGRAHKSNNVAYVVDTYERRTRQICFDADCRNWAGPWIDTPDFS